MKGRILVTASMVVALAASAHAQLRDGRENPLTAARDLYASARYDEALAVLSGLPSDVVATDRKSIEQYRSLCLLALGRSTEAESAIAAVITADPLFMLREFEYQIDADRFLRIISRDRDQPMRLDAEVVPYEKQIETVSVRGQIDSEHPSVIAAMAKAGETDKLAMLVAEIFSGQIDFDSDLQPGDSFDILVEKSSHDGQFSGYGAVLGARFLTDGRDLRAFRWTDPGSGKPAFYDENGRSLKRFFLRSPLRFEPRITSGFSRSRLHPIYRTYRAHLGIDYGAPVGAPVVAVASGTVVSAGWSGGGGNMIRIRHASGFESYYLHLSAFAAGIRAGAHVDQGELIGRVGATGDATGPHLDYRLRKNGVFVNPLIEHRKLPPGEPIPVAELAAFRSTADATLTRLSQGVAAEGPTQKPDAVSAATDRDK